MRLEFLLAAELDIQRAYIRYEDREEGLGDRFTEHLDTAFRMLEDFPLIAPLHFESYRRLILRSFPYGVFYVVESDRLVVHAVMDLRQDPRILRKRLLGEL